MIKFLEGPEKTSIPYLGLGPEAGPLPAFFYFALSGEESLELSPYNQPALLAACPSLRVFSFTIPGHEPGMNKLHAMQFWADQMAEGKSPLQTFFKKTAASIRWLIDSQIAHSLHLAVGGLSRGGFIAAHIAALVPGIHTLLGFAPLTDLMALKEFSSNPHLQREAKELDLIHLADSLAHVKSIRFYIGNHDTRVDTDACYRFIRGLTEKGHEKKLRHQTIELIITHSIGHQGHGTSSHIFEEGSLWVKNLLLGNSL